MHLNLKKKGLLLEAIHGKINPKKPPLKTRKINLSVKRSRNKMAHNSRAQDKRSKTKTMTTVIFDRENRNCDEIN